MHFHRWMQNVLLFLLSRILIFQVLKEKNYQQDLKENMNLRITEGYLWLETSQPALKWKDVAYTAQRLLALQCHPHGKSTVLHMSHQHAPNCLEGVNWWETDILISSLLEEYWFVTFLIFMKFSSFSQAPGLDLCTLRVCMLYGSWCVCYRN